MVDASTLVLFRKCLKPDIIMEANEYILATTKEKASKSNGKDDNNTPPASGGGTAKPDNSKVSENRGTFMLDATCAPSNIRYPQDFSLLREKLETIIICFCKTYGL
jgi:hypothetical protein